MEPGTGKTIVVFGASGVIGRHVVDEAVRAGYRVRAFTRDASKIPARDGVEPIQGDALDPDAVARAIQGSHAVISALGPTTNRKEEVEKSVTAIRNIVRAMDRWGVRRLVGLSGAAVQIAGERKPLGGRIASFIVRLLAGNVVRAKQREYEETAATTLDWTVVRPPRVVDRPAAGRAIASDRLHSRSISESDLAAFMVSEVDAAEHVREAPFVSG